MAKITGGDKFRRDLKTLEKETRGGVVRALEVASLEMVNEADQRIPVDQGQVRQQTGFRVDRDALKGFLYSNAPHAPFVEFGTGSKVKVPAELQELAAQFKGKKSGSFQDLLINIQGWCKRKGIDAKAAYPIAMSIAKKGISGHGFMYAGLQKGKSVFTKQISLLVKSVSIRK